MPPKRKYIDIKDLQDATVVAELKATGGMFTSAPEDEQSVSLAYAKMLSETLYSIPLARQVAHCSKSFDKIFAYERNAVTEAFRMMQCVENRFLAVEGPPGCGKSTTALFAALTNVFLDDVPAWVNLKLMVYAILPHAGEVVKMKPLSMNKLPSQFKSARVIYLDGATATAEHEAVLKGFFAYAQTYGKFVRVTSSMQVSAALLKTYNCAKYRMRGWTLEEYQTACANPHFFAQVLPKLLTDAEKARTPPPLPIDYTVSARKELIRRKFGVAGHSARWMFDQGFDDVKDAIDDAISAVDNITELFGKEVQQKSKKAKNSLVQQDPTGGTSLVFTSALVAQLLAARIPTWLPRLHELTRQFGNQAMKNHVVQADFLYNAQTGRLRERVWYVEEAAVATTLAQMVDDDVETSDPLPFQAVPGRALSEQADSTFYPQTCDTSCIRFYHNVLHTNTSNVEIGTWMIPEVPSLGGFTAAQLLVGEDEHLFVRFVQVTMQLDHPIKIDFIRTFLNSLNDHRATFALPPINHIEVVVVLPKEVAAMAAPPALWRVRGMPRSGGLHVSMRVAGFELTHSASQVRGCSVQ